MARDWQERLRPEIRGGRYHNAIRRTLERTEAFEKHVKTVTMRADSLATTEADFVQTLIERQEESIRELHTLYGQLRQPRPTQL